jgi:hypothetical protein
MQKFFMAKYILQILYATSTDNRSNLLYNFFGVEILFMTITV